MKNRTEKQRTNARIRPGWEAYWHNLTDHLNAPERTILPDSIRDGSTVVITGVETLKLPDGTLEQYRKIEAADGRTATIPLAYLEEITQSGTYDDPIIITSLDGSIRMLVEQNEILWSPDTKLHYKIVED